MSGKKAISVRHRREPMWYLFCTWACGGAGAGVYSFDIRDDVHPLVNFSCSKFKSHREKNGRLEVIYAFIYSTNNY